MPNCIRALSESQESNRRFLSAFAIAAKRESLGISMFSSRRSFWSKREIEFLGKRPDPVVARMVGRFRYAVQLKRHSLGIPQAYYKRSSKNSSLLPRWPSANGLGPATAVGMPGRDERIADWLDGQRGRRPLLAARPVSEEMAWVTP